MRRLICLVLTVTAAGCRSPQTGSDGPPAAAVRPAFVTPSDVATRLSQLRREARLEEMRPMILADRRDQAVRFLRAIDQVLAANDRVQAAAEQYIAPKAGEAWDLSAIRDNFGLFSSQTKVVSCNAAGNQADVLIREGDHLPLVHEHFTRVDGQWCYAPEPIAERRIDDLRRLAGRLDAVAAMIASGDKTQTDIARMFEEDIIPLISAIDEPHGQNETGPAEASADAARIP
ncbi:MAG: hypothetical protein U1A27_04230 [Phycisphaerae bacterium]